MVKPRAVSRPWLAVPLVAFALVALTVGIVARQRLASGKPYFHLFFTDTIHMKVWLATAAIVLALSQLVTASRIYGLLHFPPPGRLYNIVHRWSGRTAIALTLPVAYHCIFLLGFSTYSTRVYIHSLLGSAIYGAFIGKVVIVRTTGFPGWALPVAGGTLFSILLGIWLSSGLWFLTTHGVRL
jgi:Family of unknown function (DUF6529)